MDNNLLSQVLIIILICVVIYLLYLQYYDIKFSMYDNNENKSTLTSTLIPTPTLTPAPTPAPTSVYLNNSDKGNYFFIDDDKHYDLFFKDNIVEEKLVDTASEDKVEDTRTIAEIHDDLLSSQFPRELQEFENGEISGVDNYDLYNIEENSTQNKGHFEFATY